MKTAASILVVGLYALPFATNAADMRDVLIIVGDTLGNPLKQY